MSNESYISPEDHDPSLEHLFVVRFYDGFDNEWMDCTKPISFADAASEWDRLTCQGTKNTSYNDIDYYAIFPANTKMAYTHENKEAVRLLVGTNDPEALRALVGVSLDAETRLTIELLEALMEAEARAAGILPPKDDPSNK
jgi:hypothetical protein